MDKYKVDDDKIAVIEKTFGTDRETVKKMNSLYQGISDGMKYQYLAHVIRTVEEKIRMELHSPLFQIRQPIVLYLQSKLESYPFYL